MSTTDRGRGEGEVSTRVLTVPNLISFARISLIPVFAWLYLSGRADRAAFFVLALIGTTDWVDGFVARRTGQVSVLGKLLDPIADRAAIMTVLLALAFRGTIPWQLAAAILLRDLAVSTTFVVLEGRGFPRIPVNMTGKVATSIIFLGIATAVGSVAFSPSWQPALQTASSWILTAGALLYFGAAFLYLGDVRRLKTARSAGSQNVG